ncbi:MAG: fumarate hydratase class II [Thermoanaerobaculum sp.]|nr:MAG: fumarate hydratase class II [Thermoanaerobaculum sp.]
MSEHRKERDTLGEVMVPAEALYGAQTARAVANFPISGWTMPVAFLRELVLIKKAMAVANGEKGLLPQALANAIAAAADEVLEGGLWQHFPVDVFQTGSATSTNMNANEVLAFLANRRLGSGKVHPNDHVNLGQSSNDVIPTAARMAAFQAASQKVIPEAQRVVEALRALAQRYRATVTLGRTHLVDAVPTTYGRIFDAWARRLARACERLQRDLEPVAELPLGGTALGSGLNANREATEKAVELLRRWTGGPWRIMANPAVGIAGWDDLQALAQSYGHLAGVLFALAQDLRLRSSGPYGGLGELQLPAVQPGSSLMPGKVNPVIPEAVAQAALEVRGLVQAVTESQALSQLDLFHAGPLLIWNLDTSAQLLASSCRVLVDRCLAGLAVNEERCRELASRSPALATALAREVGYEQAAAVAKLAQAQSLSVLEAGRRLGIAEALLQRVLDLERLAGVVKEDS